MTKRKRLGLSRQATRPQTARRRLEKIDRDATISLLVEENPKQPGSKAFVMFAKLRTGMSVAKALRAGVTMGDIKYAIRKRQIAVGDYDADFLDRNRRDVGFDNLPARLLLRQFVERSKPIPIRKCYYHLAANPATKKIIPKDKDGKTQGSSKVAAWVNQACFDLTFRAKYPELAINPAWIIDAGRDTLDLPKNEAPVDWLRDAFTDFEFGFSLSLVAAADVNLFLMPEKLADKPFLSKVSTRFDVPVIPNKGFDGKNHLFKIAAHIAKAWEKTGKPTIIYQYGDRNWEGDAICRAIRNTLLDMFKHPAIDCPDVDLDVVRSMVTKQQAEQWVEEHGIEMDEKKRKDGTVEYVFDTDAVPPQVYRELVEADIKRHISDELIEEVEEREQRHQDNIKEVISEIDMSALVEQLAELESEDD